MYRLASVLLRQKGGNTYPGWHPGESSRAFVGNDLITRMVGFGPLSALLSH